VLGLMRAPGMRASKVVLTAAVLVGLLAVPAAAPAKTPKLAGNYEGPIVDPLSPPGLFAVSFTINKKNRMVDPVFPLGLSAYTCARGILSPIRHWEGIYPSSRVRTSGKRPTIFVTGNVFFIDPKPGFGSPWEVTASLDVRGRLVKKGKFRGTIHVFFKWADPQGLISPCGTPYGENSGTTTIAWTAKKK
jgi:hypothetical protein